MKVIKTIFMTVLFPIMMFLAMLLITSANPVCIINGKNIFLGNDLIRNILLNTCTTVCVALAIWLQLKNGRFDFSIGSSMILTSILAGTFGYQMRSPLVTLVAAVVIAVVLNVINALVYIYGRLPIIISSIAVTLLFESMTYLVCGGSGISSFYPDTTMNVFGRLPLIFIPAVISMAVFLFFDKYSTAGRKAKVLSRNQGAGVNIGIDEKKNVLVSYVFTGIIIGMSALIYVSQNSVGTQSGLSTSGVMFSYIAPVFMGMFLGSHTNDVVGILMSSISLAILSYGLNCMNLGAGGWQNIIFGVFVMGFYGITAKMDDIKAFFARKKTRTAA